MTSPARAPRPTPRRAAEASRAPSRRDHLRVVPDVNGSTSARRRAPRPVAFGFALLLVFASLLASAVFHGLLASGQSHIDDVEARIEVAKTDLARDKLELANLQAPARIAAEAEKLGMVPAERQVWLSPGNSEDAVVTGEATVEDTGGAAGDELAGSGTEATTR